MKQTEALANFLKLRTFPDLADLYTPYMECQVNVAQCGGEVIESGRDRGFVGRSWRGYTNGTDVWKPFRIPWNASTEPSYDLDKRSTYDLDLYAEGVGMTGWDWYNRLSRWVAFDFDAMMGHSDRHQKKLSPEELADVQTALMDIPWVTIRRSTSGSGLHVYVFLEPIETNTHTEHAALARYVLGQMSAFAGINFSTKVDICGQNMWVWHRKMRGTNGLSIVKSSESFLTNIDPSWREHVEVVSRKRTKPKPTNLEEDKHLSFEDLAGQMPQTPLDKDHKRLLQFLEDSGYHWFWDQDRHLLVTHTFALKEAHKELNLAGIFDTISTGKEVQNDKNCFLFPLTKGSWIVRRFSAGCVEHVSWEQDGQGWTKCWFNKPPDLSTVARSVGAAEHPKGGYVFNSTQDLERALAMLDILINNVIPAHALDRTIHVSEHKDGRLVLEIKKETEDIREKWKGWVIEKGRITKVLGVRLPTNRDALIVSDSDDLVRHLVSIGKEDAGWVLRVDDSWIREPVANISMAMASQGLAPKDIKELLGNCIMKPWHLVSIPFAPEYPGDKRWNLGATQLAFAPTLDDEPQHPTWDKLLKHVGTDLDDIVANNAWAKENGVKTGGDYLKIWVASMIQAPYEPLPYLFFHGPQNIGKSTIYEAIAMLLTNGGAQRAENALTSTGNFNGELENCVLAVVEEIDMKKDMKALARIKDWVTAKELPLHRKGQDPYLILNTTHWMQFSNFAESCPIFPGDKRVTVIRVNPLDPMDMIPKKLFLEMLKKEASHFLATVLKLEIPPSGDRLNVPVLATEEKAELEALNENPIDRFVRECCVPAAGHFVLFSEFYAKFLDYANVDKSEWSSNMVARKVPNTFPRARHADMNNNVCIGNISFDRAATPLTYRWVTVGTYLKAEANHVK